MGNMKNATHFMVSDGITEQHALYLKEANEGKRYVAFLSEGGNSEIRVQLMEDFLAPYETYTTYSYPDNIRLYDDMTVINRALSVLEKTDRLPYFNSGEEFVEWCFKGEPLEDDLVVSGIHIKASRGVYEHHGIYIGKYSGTDIVAHYSGFSEFMKKGEITLTTLEEFQGEADTIYCVEYPPEVIAYSKFEVVNRARERLNENSYNLFTNNCEHFACWCITGQHSSDQVKHLQRNVKTTAITVTGLRMMLTGFGMYATSTAIGGVTTTATLGVVGGIVTAPVLVPLAIGAGAVAVWKWFKD